MVDYTRPKGGRCELEPRPFRYIQGSSLMVKQQSPKLRRENDYVGSNPSCPATVY